MTRIGYVPLHQSLRPPGDRRRFSGYAGRRGIDFVVVDDWRDVDVAVLSTEADLLRWASAPSRIKMVLDLPDAFLDEPVSKRTRARGLAKWVAGPLSKPVLRHDRAMLRLVARADAVVCSTPEQAQNLGHHAGNVHVVLDDHSEVTPMAPRSWSDRKLSAVHLVWEGMFPTLGAVEQVLPGLRLLAEEEGVVLHLVTDRRPKRYMNRFLHHEVADVVAHWDLDVQLHDWDVETLESVGRDCHLAIVPVVRSDPYALGKPENRMRLFWRLGLPVLASDSPAHRRAVGLAGVAEDTLCGGASDWSQALRRYASEPAACRAAAEAGHRAALGPYGSEAVMAAWDGVLASIGVQP
ncbi:MAG: hypothetical protein CL466_08505 [Acidimicrobiaceae bacterium]|nr:hypothetical protein [Acidimicrobiaceae bacterium]